MNATTWPDFTPDWTSCARKSRPAGSVRRAAPSASCRTSPSATPSRACTRTAWRSSTPSTTDSCSAAWTSRPPGRTAPGYIGRIGPRPPTTSSRLMIDWRAPEAGAFYQATAFDRQGVRRRRHLILRAATWWRSRTTCSTPTLLGRGCPAPGRGRPAGRPERPSAPAGCPTSSAPSRPSRTGSSARRWPASSSSRAVPGTGKTAVALHRAAYLLYTHRERLKSAGVLLVGPSSSFMRYIERVLPSLGRNRRRHGQRRPAPARHPRRPRAAPRGRRASRDGWTWPRSSPARSRTGSACPTAIAASSSTERRWSWACGRSGAPATRRAPRTSRTTRPGPRS